MYFICKRKPKSDFLLHSPIGYNTRKQLLLFFFSFCSVYDARSIPLAFIGVRQKKSFLNHTVGYRY